MKLLARAPLPLRADHRKGPPRALFRASTAMVALRDEQHAAAAHRRRARYSPRKPQLASASVSMTARPLCPFPLNPFEPIAIPALEVEIPVAL
jgi:hypothetical protein